MEYNQNKRINKYIQRFSIKKGYNRLRPVKFYIFGRTNVQCTFAARNYMISRFSMADDEADKNAIVREEMTSQYVKKGFKWSADGEVLRAGKVAQLKQS